MQDAGCSHEYLHVCVILVLSLVQALSGTEVCPTASVINSEDSRKEAVPL